MARTGDSATGTDPTGETAGSFRVPSGKTGEHKTGERLTGGILTASAQSAWVINGVELRVQSVVLTPTTLRLTVRARSAAARGVLEDLDGNAGAVDERERADGTVAGLDLAGGKNTVAVYPPGEQRPERIPRSWVVDSVGRDRASADTLGTIATVEFTSAATRDPVVGYSDPADSTAWEFDLGGAGRIVTDRVSSIRQDATTSVEVILEPLQAELFETTAAATAGSVVRTVPDGTAFAEDTTPGSRQTVTVTPPSGEESALPADEYVVDGWESDGRGGGAYRVRMDLSTRYEPQ